MTAAVRGTERFLAGPLAGIELPWFETTGAHNGPRLCILAGIHGCEYSSIAAAVRFMRSLDPAGLHGSVIAAPVANPDSYFRRTPFVSPADGKNLNRCFPGDPAGSYSDALAHVLIERFVRGSDALVDLHGGDMVEALEPFSLYDASPVEDASRGLAEAFGLPWMVRSTRSDAPIAGTTSGAAADLGIRAIIAEVGGRGLLEEEAIAAHLRGLARVVAHLGMTPTVPPPEPAAPARMVNRFVWLRCANAGWWQPSVATGRLVRRGEQLGAVHDLHGEELERIDAPDDGVILFLTSSPAVTADGLLLGLGADVEP
jgi:predicted deacylase